MFRRLSLTILSFTILNLLALLPVKAIYDPLSVPNNQFGVHILETEELSKAAELVNSSGGDWGYVTIPIRANERNLPKWTQFMKEAKKLHLIPILRIASFPVDDHWMAPNEYDLLDFANFLNELPWPTKNRYVVVYNEPNHKNEWGGFVYPEEYAKVLDRAIDIFHRTNQDFFVISAGLDSSAPNTTESVNEYDYLRVMQMTIPGIFGKIDGFSSHSYGNPGFSSFPNLSSSVSVANYRYEENFLKNFGVTNLKIFITEAGWRADLTGDPAASRFFETSFTQIWTDSNIVAVTPFVLSAGAGPFAGFSLVDPSGNFKPFAQKVQSLPKKRGSPELFQSPQTPLINQIPTQNPQTSSSSPIPTILTLWQRFLSLFRL